nr:ras GTPase-activating-like protein IQGAP3 [Chrysemys picta bellii]
MEPAAESGPARAGYERLTADEMDEQRRQNVAYQYLCRLEEAKRWMEACLNEELASPTELEESLRNGVILAKLGHCFAPDVVPLKKIYDREQRRYEATGLHFRHTDNINHWREAMTRLGLPTIFHPETTDIYDKKNMPRVVYCIHALSLYLFKLGLAPQIQDLYGKVNFTEEEINNMKRELEKYGLQMPAFSKIGGILASELSVDEAAVHAAVLAINEAVERGVVEQTMAALHNPSAMLLHLRENLAAVYQEMLYQVKMEKAGNARNRYLQESPESEDIYDRCLTQAEIQGNINKVNVHGALEYVDDALERQDPPALCRALQDPVLALRGVQRENAAWYLDQLSTDREQKALELGYVDLLEQEEVQAGIYAANEKGDQEHAMRQAVSRINASIRRGEATETVRELMSPEAQLPEAFPFAAQLYQHELALLQQHHPQGELGQEELYVAVEMLSAVALIDRALEAGDVYGFWSSLVSPALGLSDIEDANAQRYFDDLLKLKHRSGKAGVAFLSWNDIQACVNSANSAVQDENDKILAIRLINEALAQDDPEKTLTALLLPSAGFSAVTLPGARRYHHVLTAALRQKAQVTGDDGAALWWEEIQQGVSKANQDTEAARRLALGIAAINQAIKEGKPAQTARVLCNPDVSLRGVVAECAGAYQAQLATLLATKRQAGNAKRHWVRHQLKDGSVYYFSLQSFEGSWERPRDSVLNSTHLSREEIQAGPVVLSGSPACSLLALNPGLDSAVTEGIRFPPPFPHRKFICAACSVPEPEERFNVDEYSEMVAVAKPVVYITAAEIINTHKLLLEHQDSISPDHKDPLHELLEDLDGLPTVQSLIGESAPNPGDGSPEQALAQLGKQEVSLTLTNKFDAVEASSEEADTRSLLLSTKQMLVDVIQSQPGDSLLEILRTAASEDQEAFHHHQMHRRALREAQTPDRLKRNRSLAGNSQLSMEEKKQKVIRNLRRLESLGVVDSANQYQEIINEMAKDIRNQRRYRLHRKGELVKLRQTLCGLNSKTLFYEEQIDYYNQYIRTCLDNLAASSKLNGKSKKQPSLHYTGARLFEKGVLLEIEDLPVSQFRNVVFDIVPCGEAGKFQVKARFMGIDMEKFQLHYQDLLQLQYEGVAVMKLFNKAKVNVNLLIFLLNKKFFRK